MNKIKQLYNNIANYFIIHYNNIINKIALNSKLYKSLYNRVILNEVVFNHLEEIKEIRNLPSIELLNDLIDKGQLGKLNLLNSAVLGITQSDDLYVVNSLPEKDKILKFKKRLSSDTAHITDSTELENIENSRAIYVSNNIWIKDLVKINNILYRIEQEKEKYSL